MRQTLPLPGALMPDEYPKHVSWICIYCGIRIKSLIGLAAHKLVCKKGPK